MANGVLFHSKFTLHLAENLEFGLRHFQRYTELQ
jgi:hypothetical protein